MPNPTKVPYGANGIYLLSPSPTATGITFLLANDKALSDAITAISSDDAYLPLTGGTLTGNLYFGNDTYAVFGGAAISSDGNQGLNLGSNSNPSVLSISSSNSIITTGGNILDNGEGGGVASFNNNVSINGNLQIQAGNTGAVTYAGSQSIQDDGNSGLNITDGSGYGINININGSSNNERGGIVIINGSGGNTVLDDGYGNLSATSLSGQLSGNGTGITGINANNITLGTLGGTYGGTGVNNGSKTITLGGNLTTSGAYNLTLTVSATTSVTLPTSGTLAVTGANTFTGDQTISTHNLVTDTATGSKIGTASNQKLGFWNATPVTQQTTSGSSSTIVANSGTTVNQSTTYDGYTIQQVVKALRTIGILA